MLEWDDSLARTKWAPIKDDSLVKKMFVANLCYTEHIIIMATFFFPFSSLFILEIGCVEMLWLGGSGNYVEQVSWLLTSCFFGNRQISTTSAPLYSLSPVLVKRKQNVGYLHKIF